MIELKINRLNWTSNLIFKKNILYIDFLKFSETWRRYLSVYFVLFQQAVRYNVYVLNFIGERKKIYQGHWSKKNIAAIFKKLYTTFSIGRHFGSVAVSEGLGWQGGPLPSNPPQSATGRVGSANDVCSTSHHYRFQFVLDAATGNVSIFMRLPVQLRF